MVYFIVHCQNYLAIIQFNEATNMFTIRNPKSIIVPGNNAKIILTIAIYYFPHTAHIVM